MNGHPRTRLTWSSAYLAVLILAAMLFPWPVPFPEVVLDRFDPTLVLIDPEGILPRSGSVQLTPHELILTTEPRSQPTVHVLTAEVPFTATFTVTVVRRQGEVFPFQVKVWDPRSGSALEAWYTPDGTILAGVRKNDQWRRIHLLGTYTPGAADTWWIRRATEEVSMILPGGDGRGGIVVDRRSDPDLVGADVLSLAIYATAPKDGSAMVAVNKPSFTVPKQTRYGTTVNSPWFGPMTGMLIVLSLLWLAPRVPSLTIPRMLSNDVGVALILGGVVSLLAVALSSSPAHPLDALTARAWSYIAGRYGPQSVVGYSMLASGAAAYAGQPYAPVTYPYPPLLTYMFWLVGSAVPNGQVVPAVRILTTVAVGVGGVVLFLLLRSLNIARRGALLAAVAYALNPAILFDSAVWGQTDSIVALFLLMGAAGVLLGSAPLLWLALLLASLTKQTGGLFAVMLVPLGLLRFGVRQMLRALSPAIVVGFLALSPLFLAGLHPAAVYRPIITKMLQFGTVRAMEVVNAVVSQGGFTPWSAVAYLEGARGVGRMAFPDYVHTRLGPSYFTLSWIVFGLLVLALGTLLLRRRRSINQGSAFLTLAAFSVGAALLLTRVQPRYLYFGIMFTAASLPWMPRWIGGAALAVLSATMLVGMWGMLAFTSIWYEGLVPAFHPDRSWLNGLMTGALSSDIVITLAGVVNVGALLGLLLALWANSGGRGTESSLSS